MFLKSLALALAFATSYASADSFDSNFYHARYGLQDPFAKLVNNRGDGFEALYGVRNFREVLRGVFYRGGANNVFNKYEKRDNQNPLPDGGLMNLCAEGFKSSVYLYSTNFETAPSSVTCSSVRGANHLTYMQINPRTVPQEILKMVHAAIIDHTKGPIYAHCWNGWHASGLISALALRQFCDVRGDEAVAYWEANVDGHDDVAYAGIKKQIRNFAPAADMRLDHATQARICPQL